MNPKKTTQDLLNKLDLFDPDTGKKVRSDLQNCRTAVSPEMLAVLVDETIWGLSLETSFGLAVARGMLLLICRDPSCLHRYQAAIHLAGEKGPTLGRLMATHLVPVLLSGHSRIRQLFFETFEMMENAGVYTLPKPLEALDRMLFSDDCRSAETYLNLLHSAFSREMPYHRRQQLTVLLPKAALQYAPAKRPWQLQQLERVMRIDDRLASALINGMNKGLDLLSPAALLRFVSQGIDQGRTERKRGERFFALESRAGCSAFAELQVAVSLPEVQPHLNRYLTARTGREVSVRSLSVLNAGTNDVSPAAAGTCSDGNSVYLPDEIDRFDTPADNRKVYKCLARFEAGLIEFGTYRFDLEKTLEQCSCIPGCSLPLDIEGIVTDREETISDLERFFGLFPQPQQRLVLKHRKACEPKARIGLQKEAPDPAVLVYQKQVLSQLRLGEKT